MKKKTSLIYTNLTRLSVDIDLDYVDEIREQLPLLKHRRSDLYELLEK